MLKINYLESGSGNVFIYEMEDYKFMSGSIFDEAVLTETYTRTLHLKKDEEMTDYLEFDKDQGKEDFPLTTEQMKTLAKAIEDLDCFIVTDYRSLLSLPYIFKKFNKVKVIATLPILQTAKFILREFYSCFNKMLIGEACSQNELTYVSPEDIENFVSEIHSVNFNEKFVLDPQMKLTLVSSGYELGSSNILFEFYNKKIVSLGPSSNFSYRYTKSFDWEILSGADLLLCPPKLVNYTSDYEQTIGELTSTIYKVSSELDIKSSHFPSIFMPTNVFFLLDFVDLLRYKVTKDLKKVYVSESVRAVIEYANISHGFINKNIHDKIYEFKLPFNFDELGKSMEFYHFKSFSDLLKNQKEVKPFTSPTLFMVNDFSFIFGEGKNVHDSFRLNFNDSDTVITLDSKVHDTYLAHPDAVKANRVFSFNYDYRLTPSQFGDLIINKIKPKKVFLPKSEHSLPHICKVLQSSDIQFEFYEGEIFQNFDKEEIWFDEVFHLGKSPRDFQQIANQAPDKSYSFNFKRENEKFFFDLNSIEKDEYNKFDQTESNLKSVLRLNGMEVVEFLAKEEKIHISIIKRDSGSYAQMQLNLGEEVDVEIESENYEDSQFLNNAVQFVFN